MATRAAVATRDRATGGAAVVARVAQRGVRHDATHRARNAPREADSNMREKCGVTAVRVAINSCACKRAHGLEGREVAWTALVWKLTAVRASVRTAWRALFHARVPAVQAPGGLREAEGKHYRLPPRDGETERAA